MASGTICAPVKYLRRLPLYDHEKPFQYLIPIPPDSKDQRTTNVEFETREQTFTDIRHRLGDFNLDRNGFEVISVPTSLRAVEATDQDVIKGRYLPEVEKILRDNVAGGFDRVVFFDWRVRDAAVPEEATKMKMSDLSGWLRPVGHVHIDHAPRAIVGRVQSLHVAGDDSNFLLRGRVRVINVWRPLDHPVEDFPLAFCDASTLAEQDIVECDHVRRNYRGATLYPYFDPGQKFYYVGGQTPDEVVLFKIFDSDPDVRAKRCAHCSFGHPSQTPTSRPRKSIEVRALLFNYP